MKFNNISFTAKKTPYFTSNGKEISLEQCIFLDIETVSGEKSFNDLPDNLKSRWKNKVENWTAFSENSKTRILSAVFEEFEKDNSSIPDKTLLDVYKSNKEANYAAEYAKVAALYPEYSKIICISIGYMKNNDFVLTSFLGQEKELLANFQFGVNKVYDRIVKDYKECFIVGHNISFFDAPVITKRMFLNGLKVPSFLHGFGQKPWDKKLIDTASEWRSGSTTGDATLETLSILMLDENPKEGLHGSKLTEYYYSDEYNENELINYCEGDVIAVKELFEKLQNLKTMIN